MKLQGREHERIDFVAVGHVTIDIRDNRRHLGGAAAYSSLTARALGLSTAMVTAVGNDFDFFSELAGVEVHYHEGLRSTSFENLYHGAVRHQRLLGLAPALREQDVACLAPRLAGDAIILFCPIAAEVPLTVRRLTREGLCGIAPQGLFRRWDSDGRVLVTPCDDLEERLAETDFVSLSASDPPELDRVIARLIRRVPLVAVTEGTRGARLYAGQRGYRVPAFPVKATDPTGAGDVFAASFLIALQRGFVPLDAAQFACCAASFAVEGEGVEGVPPDWDAVEERFRQYLRAFHPTPLDDRARENQDS